MEELGGLGLVHITDSEGVVANDPYIDFPATTVVTPKNAAPILEYVNSTR